MQPKQQKDGKMRITQTHSSSTDGTAFTVSVPKPNRTFTRGAGLFCLGVVIGVFLTAFNFVFDAKVGSTVSKNGFYVKVVRQEED